ncbi:hypothetical protein NN561_001746 [Cricetulus griseus]
MAPLDLAVGGSHTPPVCSSRRTRAEGRGPPGTPRPPRDLTCPPPRSRKSLPGAGQGRAASQMIPPLEAPPSYNSAPVGHSPWVTRPEHCILKDSAPTNVVPRGHC